MASRSTIDPRGGASFHAAIDVDAPAFPFPHRIEVTVAARERQLAIDTTIIPSGQRAVPVAFGWHPYLRLPGTPRRQWRLRLPARAHLALDDRGIPTGDEQSEAAEAEPIGRRKFDDLYGLGRSITSASSPTASRSRCGRHRISVRAGVGSGRPPVRRARADDAPTNSLVDGTRRSSSRVTRTPRLQPHDRGNTMTKGSRR